MAVVMDADRVSRSLIRIAHEIVEHNRGAEDLALVGIRARGVPLAARLAASLRQLTGVDVPRSVRSRSSGAPRSRSPSTTG